MKNFRETSGQALSAREVVQKIKDYSTKATLADASVKDVLESLGIAEDDIVVISFGEDLSASTLLTLHLKELKAKTIIGKEEDIRRIK